MFSWEYRTQGEWEGCSELLFWVATRLFGHFLLRSAWSSPLFPPLRNASFCLWSFSGGASRPPWPILQPKGRSHFFTYLAKRECLWQRQRTSLIYHHHHYYYYYFGKILDANVFRHDKQRFSSGKPSHGVQPQLVPIHSALNFLFGWQETTGKTHPLFFSLKLIYLPPVTHLTIS